MKDYTDVELEVFAKELGRALNHMNHLTEPTEEYSMFELDITKNLIYSGYIESTRKSIERLLETIHTEQALRNTLKEEMIKKLDSYSIAELTDLHLNITNEIAHQRDILSKLSEDDGTNFKRDIEDFIERQENYLTLLTETIKKRVTPVEEETGTDDNNTNTDDNTGDDTNDNNTEQPVGFIGATYGGNH